MLITRTFRYTWLAFIHKIEERRQTGMTIFLLALLVILATRLIVPDRFFQTHEPPDYVKFYRPVALNILDGAGIVTDDGEVAVRYPPGFPVLLAGTFGLGNVLGVDNTTAALTLTTICLALVPVMVFYLARTLFGLLAGWLASLLWITYPFALRLIGQPFSEPPFLVVFIGALWLLWHTLLNRRERYINYLLYGLLIGVAMLIRPAAIGMGVVSVLIIWIAGRSLHVRGRVIASALVLAGNLIAVMPWQLYASARTDETVLLSSGGLPSTVFGVMFAVTERPYHPNVIGIPDDVIDLQSRIYERDSAGDIKTLSGFVGLMWDELQTDTMAVIKLMAIKTLRSWYATSSTQQDNLILVLQIPYLLLAVTAFVTVWRRHPQQRTIVTSLLLIVLYLWALTTVALPLLRYMMPAMAIIMVWVAPALVIWLKLELSPPHTQPEPNGLSPGGGALR